MDLDIILRQATQNDIDEIWKIFQQAILKRKKEGSSQWQDGYPNYETIQTDINKNIGFVFTFNSEILGYSAIIFNDEPVYEDIDGKWISQEDFYVIHRVAIAEKWTGKGLSKIFFELIEDYVKSKNVKTIKLDTNFDNLQMLSLMNKLNYIYCGKVYFRGSERKAFQKILT